MLKLTRRTGETVVIGDDIGITVISIRGNQVRLVIDAPKDIPVHRWEIYNRIKREQRFISSVDNYPEYIATKNFFNNH